MAIDWKQWDEKRETERAKRETPPAPTEEGTTWTQDRMAELNTEIEDSAPEETYTFDPEESRQNFNAIGTLVSNTFDDIARAETDYVMAEQGGDEEEIERARVNAIRAPFKESAREFIAAYGDDNKSPFQSFAQGLRQSSANLEYFMTPEEKIAKAREIGDALNIPAGALAADTEAMQNAMGVYDYAKKIEAAGGSMEKVYQEFPKLAEIAGMDPQGAALALHDLHHIREVRDVAGAWAAFWKSGEDSYDYGVLKAKDALEGLTDEERERADELKKSMENAPVAPSFFVNPAVAMLSGLQSLPEMIYSTAKAVPYGVTGGVIGAAVMGAPTGGAGLPAGAVAGFKKGFDVGMYLEMARPMMGRKFAEYQAMTDESGNRLMTDEDARELAIIETIPEALIELGGFKMGAGKSALGEHAKKVVADAMRGVTRPTASKAAAGGLWGAFKGILETGFSEMAEEFGQAYPSELMENYIKQTAKTGDVSFDASRFADTLAGADWGSITEKAAAAAMEAAPGSFFLGGITAGVGAPIGSARYGLESRAWNRQFGEMAKTERTTMTGTVMLEQLQAVVHDSKLKDTAPDVQREILRDELKDTPWQMAYVDVETALKHEGGVEDVREAGKAAGMTNEEIEQAIEEKGTIAVPLESYAQSEASSNLLDSVSFSPEAEPLAKIRENAKAVQEAYTKRMTAENKKRIELVEAMTKELFPEKREHDAAMDAIEQHPMNPMQGWRELYGQATAELDEILAPALSALERGMGQGVDEIRETNEYGEAKGDIVGRVSNNEEWYREFYKENKRRPTKAELREMARKMMTGEADAPKVQGWTATDKETAALMANEKGRLAAAEEEIAVLESIKERMQEINGTEIQLTKGLSPEAYKVYRAINTDLLKIGGKVGRAARVNALIMARHADVFAQRKQAKGEKFTVQDYMNRLKVVMGGEGYKQIASDEEMQKLIAAHDELFAKNNADDMIAARNELFASNPVADINDNQFDGLPETDKKDLFRKMYQTVDERGTRLPKTAKTKYGEEVIITVNGIYNELKHHNADGQSMRLIPYLETIIGNSTYLFEGDPLKERKKKKDEFTKAYRHYACKVNIDGKPYYVRSVIRHATDGKYYYDAIIEDSDIDEKKASSQLARPDLESGGAMRKPFYSKRIISWWLGEINRYEIGYAQKKQEHHQRLRANRMHSDTPLRISIRDMLLGVKGRDGKLLIPLDSFNQFAGENIDNLGEKMDNRRGSDEVDERTAREIENEKSAVRENYQGTDAWMKAPNGKPTNLTEEQWLAARTKAFKNRYGNWEAAAIKKELISGKAVAVDDKKDYSEIIPHDVMAGYARRKPDETNRLIKILSGVLPKEIKNTPIGDVEISGNSIRNDVHHSRSPGKIIALFYIEELLQNAQYIGHREEGNKISHVLAVPVTVSNGQRLIVTMVVHETRDGKKFYNHEFTKIKTLDAAATVAPRGTGRLAENRPQHQAVNDILAEEVWNVNDVSIAVDENGEPIFSDSPNTPEDKKKAPAVYHTQAEKSGAYARSADAHTGANPSIPQNQQKENTAQAQSRSENQGGFSDGQNPEAFSQGTKGNTKNFPDGTKLVELFASADESTFLHETGHIFLMDLEELAREGDEASKADLAIVDEWAAWHDGDAEKYKNTPWAGEFARREKYIKEAQKNGAAKMPDGTTKTLDQLLREWKQERFARAFEIYLYEGKAPSKGLRRVFRKFCEFLEQVYTALVSDGARASAQVEAVMGRMLATDEEIDAAEQDERYKDFIQAGGEKLMYEDAAETFSRWHEEAREEARDKLRKIVMRSLTGKMARRRKEILREERVKKETELSNQPVYLARQAAKETGIKDAWQAYFPNKEAWEKADKAAPTMEEALDAYMQKYEADMDTKDVQDVLKEETIEKAMSSTKSHEKLLRMEQRAFARKAALADRLSGKTRRRIEDVEQWIEKMPDAIDKDDMGTWHKAITSLKLSNRWTKEELDAIDRLSVSASKEQAKHNFETLRKIMKERKVGLADLRETNRGRVDALRKQARATIARQKLAQATQVYTHRKEEREAAKEAEALAKKERWAEAAQAKERELLASFMASEAEKIRNRQDAILKRIRTQLNAKTKLPKDERYWHQHIAYLLRVTDKDAAKPEGLKSLSDIARNLGDGLDVATDEEGKSNILDLMEKLADGNNYKDGYHGMKLEEFEDAADVLQVLYTTGKDKFNLKLTQGKTIEEAREEILNDPTAYNGARVRQSTVTGNPNRGGVFWSETLSRIPGVGDALSEYAQRYGLSMTKPEELINLLGKKAHKYMYDAYDRAAEQEAAMTAEFMGRMEEILKKRFTPDEMREWKTRAYTWDGQAVSKENILAMALNLGNDINMDRLVTGLNAVEAKLQGFIAEHMTEKDWLFCQDVWDLLQTYWPETVRVEMELNGTRLKPQEAREFNVRTKDRNGNEKEIHLRGGYYPIKYDPKLSTKSKETAENEALKGTMSGATVLGMGRGFTKDRAAKGAVKDRPLLLSLSVIPDHVNEAIHNITTRLAARDVYRLINDREIKNYVTSTLGMDAYGVLQQWATDVWKLKPTESNSAESLINNIIRPIRQNSGIAIMGYRMWPTIENATNIFPMMDALGAAETVTAMQDYYANKKEFDELIAKSLFMRERTERMDRDMRGQRDMFERHNAVSEWLVKHAYDPITFTDLLTSKPLWARAYKNAFPKMLEAVRKENEENAATYESRRAEYEKINATIIDMRKRRQAMQDELRRRQYKQAPKAETEFTRMSSQTLRDEIHIIDGEIEEKGKALFIMGEKTERASKLVIMTEQETLKEAEHRAVLEADRAVREVIGSGDVKDMSEVQRSRNEAVKALTMFYSYFNTQANAIIQAHWKGKWRRGGPGYDFTPVAKAIAYRFLLTAALSTAMRWMFFGEGDDDKDKYRKDKEGNRIEVPALERVLKQYAKNALSTTVGGLYGLREVGNWAINFMIDGTVYGGGARFDGMYGSLVNQVLKEGELILKKHERDEKAREDEEKRQEKYRNATPTQRRRMRQDEQYRKPPNTISYADILRGAGEIGTRFTAGRFGVTDPIADAVLGTMQYIFDSDGRYDATLGNMMWSAFWTKKPVKRKPPEKPAKEDKKGR